MKIAITGATGELGRLVVQELKKLHSEHEIIALVRNPEKAKILFAEDTQVRKFDYDQPDDLANSLQDVDKLLLISANEIGRRTPQHKAVIDAAIQARVPHLIYTSLLNADHSPLGLANEHRETEKLIRESSITYTFLRNNWYSENYLSALTHQIETGMVYGAAQDGLISSASRLDYATAAAQILNDESAQHLNKVYELAGSESFSLNDFATLLSEFSQQPVKYQNLSPEDYRQGLIQAGLPLGLIDVIVDADLHTAHGAMYSERKDLEHLIGRKTTPIRESIQQALNA
jgi:NAD(P)H dehydrogenase (quinone)